MSLKHLEKQMNQYKFDPMDFETFVFGRSPMGRALYKFDPMDFETWININILRLMIKYKFDPMDFETNSFIGRF